MREKRPSKEEMISYLKDLGYVDVKRCSYSYTTKLIVADVISRVGNIDYKFEERVMESLGDFQKWQVKQKLDII